MEIPGGSVPPNITAGVWLGADFSVYQPLSIINTEKSESAPEKFCPNSTITESRFSPMEQTMEITDPLPESILTSPETVPGWQKCLNCPDLGVTCNGPSNTTLGNIATARTFHKTLVKCRHIPVKRVAEAVKDKISEATVYEYFSPEEKDFKSSTMFEICKALVAICGDRVGLPPLTNACPASSSEIRAQLAAADLKLAAAELRAAQSETAVADLQQKIISVKARSGERIDQMQKDYTGHIKWMQKQMFLWQCFAFTMAAVLIVMLMYHAH